jgi:hypothetical protein
MSVREKNAIICLGENLIMNLREKSLKLHAE